MAFNFLDAVKSYFGDEMVSRASNYLGESDDLLRKGLNVVIPSSRNITINTASTIGSLDLARTIRRLDVLV